MGKNRFTNKVMNDKNKSNSCVVNANTMENFKWKLARFMIERADGINN